MIPSTQAVVVSQYSEYCLRRNIFSPTNVKVIHNALVDENFTPMRDSESLKTELGWSTNSPLIVWCGRLQRWKGTDVFINAAAMVKQQIPEARFIIIGGSLFGIESDFEKELHRLVKELAHEDCIHFTGHMRDAKRYLSAADLVVHTSVEPEPFGMVIVEAMALGKAVIASNQGGPVEIVEPNQTGLLIEPGNHQALSEAMIDLLKNENKRTAMGIAGRKRAENHFSISQMMKHFETLYDQIVSQSANSINHVASIVEG